MQVKWEIQYCFKHSNLVISGMFSKQSLFFTYFLACKYATDFSINKFYENKTEPKHEM